ISMAKNTGKVTKQGIKVDCEVLATAIASGCKQLITGEPDVFRALAGDYPIRISDVPVIEENLLLPFDAANLPAKLHPLFWYFLRSNTFFSYPQRDPLPTSPAGGRLQRTVAHR